MGLTEYLAHHPVELRLVGCEAFNYPTYARFDHARSRTIADGLVLETPHPSVQARIQMMDIRIELVPDEEIRVAMNDLYRTHALPVEPSSAITIAYLQSHRKELPQPTCVLLTGENIAREDFFELIGAQRDQGQ